VQPGSPARMFFVRDGVLVGVHDQLCQKGLWKEMALWAIGSVLLLGRYPADSVFWMTASINAEGFH